MEKVLNEQAMARMTIMHCKMATAQLVALAAQTANPALRDQAQQAVTANLQQQKYLWDAAIHAGFLPDLGDDLHTLNLADIISPSLQQQSYEQEDL